MKEVLHVFKLLSDESRVRILMLISEKELSVCQIMGVLNLSQPLVSRSLSLLEREGFLVPRRAGKHIFYGIKGDMAPQKLSIFNVLKEILRDDETIINDLGSLKECEKFQKKMGRCDMKTLKAFMEIKKKRKGRRR